MLHTYVERFDVMCGRENILGWNGEVNKAIAMKITGGNQEAQDIKKEKFKLLDVKKHIRGAPEWCT
jgi:hypothetical protein